MATKSGSKSKSAQAKSAAKSAAPKAKTAAKAKAKPAAKSAAKSAAKPKGAAAKPAAKAPVKKSAAKPAAKAPAKKTAAKPAARPKAAPAKAPARTAAKAKPAPRPAAKPAAAIAAAAKPAAKSPVRKTAPAKAPDRAAARTASKPAPKPAPKATAKPAPHPAAEQVERSATDVREHYFHEHRDVPSPLPARELPDEYGDTKIVLLPRDPEWIYAYWEINDTTREEFGLPRHGHSRRIVIRMYKITGRDWPNETAHYFYDIDLSPFASNWYLKVPEVAEQWCAELGLIDDDGGFRMICRSNIVATPRDSMSDEVDAEWMSVEETYQKLYGLSGGYTLRELRGSEEVLRYISRQVYPMLRGEAMGSGMLASMGAAGGVATEQDFWLRVHTELILYGATEPDAKVTVQGQPVQLEPDGTFRIRYALPDGEQTLDVRAVNAAGDEVREIIPIVTRRTKQ